MRRKYEPRKEITDANVRVGFDGRDWGLDADAAGYVKVAEVLGEMASRFTRGTRRFLDSSRGPARRWWIVFRYDQAGPGDAAFRPDPEATTLTVPLNRETLDELVEICSRLGDPQGPELWGETLACGLRIGPEGIRWLDL